MPVITLICLFATHYTCWLKGPAGGRTRPRRCFKLINYSCYFYILFRNKIYIEENILSW
jgi:hypothetical protein